MIYISLSITSWIAGIAKIQLDPKKNPSSRRGRVSPALAALPAESADTKNLWELLCKPSVSLQIGAAWSCLELVSLVSVRDLIHIHSMFGSSHGWKISQKLHTRPGKHTESY
jgi:hypothetical protein